jgi:hypothetical protein
MKSHVCRGAQGVGVPNVVEVNKAWQRSVWIEKCRTRSGLTDAI